MELFLEELFLNVLNMSVTASYVILFVIIARMFLKKVPKIFSYALWAIVLFRLVFPFSFSSAFSFLKAITPSSGKMEYIPAQIGMMGQPQIDMGISGVNGVINSSLPAGTPYVSVNPMQIIIFILALIWILGVLVLFTYSIASYFLLKQKVSTAMLLQGNIFECENIATAFVLGSIKPKIYLPMGLAETEKRYILKHEEIHIRRLDYMIKPFGFLVLCIHWFNPLVWLSFVLMNRDLEMSCDEQVIKELGTHLKKEYSSSLLSMAVSRKLISGSPLAFGEAGTKGRIKNVLNYKRPALWVIVAAVIAVAVLGIGLLSNPDVSANNDEEKYKLAETWAEALKLRDGKLRYEIMSKDMQEKFIAEQIRISGEEWNYVIGGSSPWVVDYEITVEGDRATILYHLADSGGDKYDLVEVLTFGTENGRLVVIDAKEKIAEWDRVSYYAPDAQSAMEAYTKALLESDYLAILGLTHAAAFDPDGQDIWDTVKINSVRIITEDVRENKACYELELDIEDGGISAFETGVFPCWLWLLKGEHGWYVEGLMTSGAPDADWWDSKQGKNLDNTDTEMIVEFGKEFVNLYTGAVAEQKQVSFEKYISNKNLRKFTDKMLELTQKQELQGGNAINYGLENEFKQAKLQDIGDNLYYLELPFEFEGSGMSCKMLITTANKSLKLVDLYFGSKDGVDTFATGHPADREINNPNLWENEEWVKGVFDKLEDLEVLLN